jgi:hypothetical protein
VKWLKRVVVIGTRASSASDRMTGVVLGVEDHHLPSLLHTSVSILYFDHVQYILILLNLIEVVLVQAQWLQFIKSLLFNCIPKYVIWGLFCLISKNSLKEYHSLSKSKRTSTKQRYTYGQQLHKAQSSLSYPSVFPSLCLPPTSSHNRHRSSNQLGPEIQRFSRML